MKILHIISGGETGGSKKHLIQLFKDAPYEAELLLLTEGEFAQEAREKGIKVTVFQQQGRRDRTVNKKVSDHIRQEGIQIVHSHGPRANFIMNNISSQLNIPWVITVHSDPKLDFLHQPKPLAIIFEHLNLRAIKKANHIFAVSTRFKEMLIKYGVEEKKISTIFNGIDFKDENNERDLINLKANYNISDKDFVAVHIARLHPVKGHSVLLEAVEKLQPLSNFKLLVVGEGPERSSIEAIIKQRKLSNQVKLLGFRKDIAQLLELADISMLTSYSESFPLVLLESANAHTPIITTDVGGVGDLIISNELGWIVQPKSVDDLMEALQEAIVAKKNQTLQRMGNLLNDHAKGNFSNVQLQNSLYQSYEVLIEDNNS
ncbi:glycosyltransferase [Paenisporosarcina sp. TG20]|uniref:glycosyltransferase n=1 Tax=Paenisporosarcina sp. TG20 TaxID=1211706 RepID=UPI0002FE1AC6|nr:glycosyltransferase [Paenisporosarcina sp. TG20]